MKQPREKAPTPDRLADFEITRRLGVGGMAEVFLAKKRGAEGTYKLLVVKRILPQYGASRRFRSMFVDEAHLATRLNHPNIVQVYEFSDHGDDGLLLAMEFVEGPDLGRLMVAAKTKEARIPQLVAAFIISEAAKGLHYAHERRDESGSPLAIVHRDVSPQNILLSFEGVVKIADFGIASANLFREEPGVLKGKFGYMSPEQARGERVDRRSDIYALGVVLYELLTLRSPYATERGKPEDDALLEAVRTGAFKPPSTYNTDLAPELEAIVLRALSATREDRYQSAREMAGAIGRFLLAKQELVDNASVETTISHLLGRDLSGTIPPEGSAMQPETQAAVPLRRTAEVREQTGQGTPERPRAVREVRHVAVVTLRIEGTVELAEAEGRGAARNAYESIRRILDNIAYRRGAVWSWDEGEARPTSARAIVGLMANPARAAADSASLAIDVQEALSGASEDLPVELRAAIGIVRGIAAGERDAQGHLIAHTLREPANLLADALATRTPFGKTWVAGGVYRLVRRDFRWGDAPALEIEDAAAFDVPPSMRLYALQRPLTKEERAAELSLLPNDLVGRDAERADLHAAFHRAVSPSSASSPPASMPPSSPFGHGGGMSGSSQPPLNSIAPPANSPVVTTGSASGPLVTTGSASGPLITTGSASGGPLIKVRAPSDEPPPTRFDGREISSSRPAPPPSISPYSAAPSTTGPLKPKGRGELVARAVLGEMGIGKTALVQTFLSELPAGTNVITVECSPVKSELPLATVCDLLREVTGLGVDNTAEDAAVAIRQTLGRGASSEHGQRVVARLAELITGKQEEGHDEEGGNYRRDLLVVGVRALLGSIALERPLVVVIDGLQWADRPSLELWQELLKRREAVPILVLVVTRLEDRVAPFIEGLVRIELRGLAADEQVRLVEARLGVREGVEAVCAELLPRVGGNPFFLLEMIDALLERGTLEIAERPGGRHELVRHERGGERAEALPSTLEQLIGDRLRELPREEHDVVDWLAVAGGPLLESDLLSLTRLADDEAITRLCARGLCDRKAGAIDFRHPLARDVAYLALDGTTRARMHRLLGEQLATTPLAQGLSAAIVARHLARGEAPGPAAELYMEAANAARAAHQAPLAQRYYQRALALLPSGDSRRMAAHEALEAIYRHFGRRRERRSHLTSIRRMARESGQARWVALALVRTARLDYDEGYLARGLPVAQRAAEIARMGKVPALEVEALTILSEILRDLGDVQGAINACERALKVAAAGGLPARARAEVLRAKGVLLRYGGRVHEAVEAYAEAIAVFRTVGARRAEARAKNSLAYAMFVLERFEDAVAVALDSIAIDLALGGRFQIAKTLSNVGQAYGRLGDIARGLLYMKRARDAHERYGDQDSRADTLLCSAAMLLEGGDIDQAHLYCGDAGALVAVTGSAYDNVHERILRALLSRARGDAEAAAHQAAEARQLSEAQGLTSFHMYATAIEAIARVDAGEVHTGVLLGRTALGALETTGASEYSIEIRALACEALRKGTPSSSRDAIARALAHIRKVTNDVRDPRLRTLFLQRPPVDRVLTEATALGMEVPTANASASSGEPRDNRPPPSQRGP
jgi:serine/threonine protein kinase/tetratricopeptide (TPR) repeat protein